MRLMQYLLAFVVLASWILFPWLVLVPDVHISPVTKGLIDIIVDGLHRYGSPPVSDLLNLARAATELTPLEVLSLGLASPTLRAAVVLPLLLCGSVILLQSIGVLIRSRKVITISLWVCAVGAGLTLIVLVASIPQIEHLGLAGDYLAELGLALIGLRLAWGYWVSLATIAVLGFLGLSNVLRSSASANEFADQRSVWPEAPRDAEAQTIGGAKRPIPPGRR